jgi:membrane associated rhomboid family serine protease
MPTCPTCGKSFSGFSFGSSVATECRDCRKAKASAAVIQSTPTGSTAIAASGSRSPLPIVTCTIIALNVLVYVAMGLSGVSWTEPSTQDAIRWGADFGPITLSSEPWRLFTSTFVHFGAIHIVLNMWCLWGLGALLEPLMGRKKFAVMYCSCGLAASIISVAWDPWRVSAGASGAIFGAAGALVSYLALKKTSLDQTFVRKNLKSLAIFILYNLARGAGGQIDNSAHIGGLLAGLVLGAIIAPDHRKRPAGDPATQGATAPQAFDDGSSHESAASRAAWSVALGAILLSIVGVIALRKTDVSAVDYGKAVELTRSGHLDEGAEQMQQAVTAQPDLLLGLALLGEMHLANNNPKAAIPILEQALVLGPNAYDLQHNLALAYVGAGRPADAIKEISKALQYEKEEAWQGHFILAAAAENMGDYPTASENFQATIRQKSDFREAQAALAALPTGDKSQRPPTQTESSALPFSKLVMKSDAFPYYP